jgi:hypothetical protein
MLGMLWAKMSWLATIHSTPPGAAVYRRNFGAKDAAWELVGHCPIEKRRMPLIDSQWRFDLKGFAPVERSTTVSWGKISPSSSLSVLMEENAKATAGMAHQTDGLGFSDGFGSLQKNPVGLSGLSGFEDVSPILLEDYWLDRYEVTNGQFKKFVDSGGYRKQQYWKHAFRKGGRTLTWSEALALFRDTTGRPGPSTWEQGGTRRDRKISR